MAAAEMFRALIAAAVLLIASLAHAQTPVPGVSQPSTPPPQVSAQDLQSLLNTLENDKAREEITAKLRAMLAAQKQVDQNEEQSFGANLIASLSQRIEQASGEAMEAATITVTLADLATWAEHQVTDPALRASWVDFLWKLAVVIAMGTAAAWATRRALTPSMRSIAERSPPAMLVRAGFLLSYSVLDLLPVAAFTAVSYGGLLLIEPRHTTRVVALMLIGATLVVGIVLALGRAILCPNASRMRIPRLRDESAEYAYIWLTRITVLAAYGHMAADAARVLGLDRAGYGLLLKVLGLAVVAMLIIVVLQNRTAIAGVVRGPENSSRGFSTVRDRLADVWHVLAIVYIAASYLVWALQIEGGFLFLVRASALTVLIVVVARIIDAALRRLVERGFAISREIRERFPNLESRANRYLTVLEHSLRAVVYTVMVLALLRAWGLHSFAWAETDAGRRAIASAITVAGVIVASIIVWEVVAALIERSLTTQGAVNARAAVRTRTLLPLLRTSLKIALIVTVGLLVLSTIGIDITPLLAGAGVVGLAIGFGSQTLVKDVITGWFILMEDQIAVGDVVKIGSHGGLVEAITIRTIRLRDFNGTVYIVPFSEAKIVENLAKEYAYYVLDVAMTYEEDLGRVVAALKEIGDGMMQDPNFKDLIMAPLEIFGIDKFDASNIIVKARIKTLPIRQWDVGREFNNRMKKRFDELGIEFPYPVQKSVQMPARQRAAAKDEDGTPPSSDAAVDRGGTSSR